MEFISLLSLVVVATLGIAPFVSESVDTERETAAYRLGALN
jgi:hypothetical protein